MSALKLSICQRSCNFKSSADSDMLLRNSSEQYVFLKNKSNYSNEAYGYYLRY